MRRIFAACTIMLAIACGGSETETKATAEAATEKTAADDLSKNPDYQKGLNLIAQSDCLTCHKVNEASTGPAYADIAAKYAGADEAKMKEIAGKIINGGTGVWGEVPMTPHPDLSEEDALAMVKYVMLLKK